MKNDPPSRHSAEEHLAAAKDHAEAAKENVIQAGDELKAAAVTKGAEVLQTAQEQVRRAGENAFEAVRAEAEFASHRVDDYIRGNPLKSAFIAFTVGFFAGAFIRDAA